MKTAVEFYDKELRELDVQLQSDLISFSIYQVLRSDAFIKSKEIEKEQKIEFACQVAEASAMKYIQRKTTRMIAEELIKQQL